MTIFGGTAGHTPPLSQVPAIHSCYSGTSVWYWLECVCGHSMNQSDWGSELIEKQAFMLLL